MKKIGFALVFTLITSSALAGECLMKVKREACPGKEAEAFKPYGGKSETEEKKDVADAAACETVAEKASKIIRKGTLSAKTVTASFAGKELGKSFSSKSECK